MSIDSGKDISIIIVNWNVEDYLRLCLQSVPAAVGSLTYETIVVDNASEDGSVPMVKSLFPTVGLIESKENLGFGRGNNLGIAQSHGRYLALVNPDVVLAPNSLFDLVEFLGKRGTVGLVGPRVYFPDGKQQKSVIRHPTAASAFLTFPIIRKLSKRLDRIPEGPTRCYSVSGCCLVFKKEALQSIGNVPTSSFMYGEELLIGHYLGRNNYEVWYYPKARIVHYDNASQKKRWQKNSAELNRMKADATVNAMKEILSPASFVVWNSISFIGYQLQHVFHFRNETRSTIP